MLKMGLNDGHFYHGINGTVHGIIHVESTRFGSFFIFLVIYFLRAVSPRWRMDKRNFTIKMPNGEVVSV